MIPLRDDVPSRTFPFVNYMLIAFNALYSWGRGEGQSSCSYLIGTRTKSEKLGPFRLDLGPRIFRNLAAHDYELRLRK